MITRETVKEYFDLLNESHIETFKNTDYQYFGIGFYVFNVGAFPFIEGFENCPNDEEEDDILSTGGCIVDADQFMQLFKESDSVNPYLIQLM